MAGLAGERAPLTLAAASPGTPVRNPTENLQAYDLYLQGRYFFDQRTPEAVAKALKKLVHFRERFHFRQIFFPENFRAIFVELFAEALDFVRGQKLRKILVRTFPDLPVQRLDGNRFSKMAKGAVPGFEMELVGIHEGAV